MDKLKRQAAVAASQIEDAIVNLLRLHPQGISNVEVAQMLSLESSYLGQHKNYLSLSLLGRLISQDRVRVEKDVDRNRNLYFSTE